MTSIVIADTGPLYAAVDRDDQYHRRALRELVQIAAVEREVLVAYPILLETYSLLLYRLGKPVAARWLNEIRTGTALLNPTAEDYRAAAQTVAAYRDQAITLFDATVAVLAKRLKLSVWTYDHHFDVMRAEVWRA